MPWFYANAGQQVGPVDDGDFDRLTRAGVIQPGTLVWRDGMAGWQPYANIAFTLSPARGQVCSECGKPVALEDTLRIDNATICAACKPTYLQKMREGLTTATTAAVPALRYAGFWIRVPAAIIDGLLLFALGIGIDVATGSTFLQAIGLQESDWGVRDWALFTVDFVLDTIYHVVLVTRYGGTIGKLLCGIRVVTADGRRLTYVHSLGRAFAQYVSLLPCGLGFILAAFDSQKRALHDRICNSRVIRVNKL
jgi:uncharacterized RDD family membrane protein YckC